MDWLNTLNTHWAPVLWILITGVFLLAWYLALRGKHQLEIKKAAIEVHRRRLYAGEITEEEFDKLQHSLKNE